jgi:dTDP-4-dehydrorhamnose reductase
MSAYDGQRSLVARPKVVVLGATGQVGRALQQQLADLSPIVLDRSRIDLSDRRSIEAGLDQLRPDLLINAAAYTAVDKAESEPAAAFAANAAAPGVMAERMRDLGGVFVHYSTDYVFDGRKPEPYVEDDATAPLNVYGASKLAGEAAVRDSGAAYLIFRTSWIYDLHGRNFLTTMRRLAGERPELRIVADQFGAPTWAGWVATATAQVVRQCFATGAARERLQTEWSGVYHLTAGGRTSWHGFAAEIVERLAQTGVTPRVPVVPIPAADYPTPAARPVNSMLSNEKVRRVFGVEQVDWHEQLRDCLAEI